MHAIRARNVNDAYLKAIDLVRGAGVRRESRNGSVYVIPEPVSIHYEKPRERVLFDVKRDANPFFHLMESLWMLAGRSDVEWLAQYLPRMKDFSDDGETFHGAYGFRWRNHFIYNSDSRMDQVQMIQRMLRNDPATRRAVLQMWDPVMDLERSSKDIPCNISATFQIEGRKLNMTVFNRSNDLILGALGANVVHFSVLQEVLANLVDCEVGWYEQISANAHVYVAEWDKRQYGLSGLVVEYDQDPYVEQQVWPYPSIVEAAAGYYQFMDAVRKFMHGEYVESQPFLYEVARPIALAHKGYRHGFIDTALAIIETCKAEDWRLACTAWLQRRRDAKTQ
jgi:thymidylate synthase